MTIRDMLAGQVQRWQEKKARAIAEGQQCQIKIDALRARQAALTPDIESELAALSELGVVKVEEA